MNTTLFTLIKSFVSINAASDKSSQKLQTGAAEKNISFKLGSLNGHQTIKASVDSNGIPEERRFISDECRIVIANVANDGKDTVLALTVHKVNDLLQVSPKECWLVINENQREKAGKLFARLKGWTDFRMFMRVDPYELGKDAFDADYALFFSSLTKPNVVTVDSTFYNSWNKVFGKIQDDSNAPKTFKMVEKEGYFTEKNKFNRQVCMYVCHPFTELTFDLEKIVENLGDVKNRLLKGNRWAFRLELRALIYDSVSAKDKYPYPINMKTYHSEWYQVNNAGSVVPLWRGRLGFIMLFFTWASQTWISSFALLTFSLLVVAAIGFIIYKRRKNKGIFGFMKTYTN